MADDIFLTPEEQDERARQWLKDNGPALLVGVVLGIGAIFGWDYYKDYKVKQAEQASAVYAEVLEQIQTSELSDVSAQIETLKQDHAGTSYAAKAALLRAKQLSVSDLPAAFNELQWVLDNSNETGVQHTARIRQAKIKMALNELDAAKKIAGHQPAGSFASHYAELLGDIAVQENDLVSARAYYQTAIDELAQGQGAYAQVLSIKLDRLPASPEASEQAAEDEPAVPG